MSKIIIFVLAGSHKEFRNWLNESIPIKDWKSYKYVYSNQTLYGMRAHDLIIIGNFYEREDWAQILKTAKSRLL